MGDLILETSTIVESVFSLFIIMLVGVYGGKKKIITSELNKGLTDILLQIALPFMIVSSFIFTYDNTIKANVIKTFYYSFIAYIVMAAASAILLIPIKSDKKTILHFANIFTNTGYIGFPILNSVYGPEGVIYGSIFNMFFAIFVWTYGVLIFKENFNREELKKEIINVFLNPSVIAVFIGILIMVFNIQIPVAILLSIRSIGNITGPLSMIIIGFILSKTKIKNYLKESTLYYGITTRLIIIPAIIYVISLLIDDRSKVMNTVIIMSAMPAAAMTSILAESFNKQKEYAAVMVSATTLLSMITLPILLKIIIR